MNSEQLTLHGRHLLDRRRFLGTAGLSTAALALTDMLSADGLLADDADKTVSGKAPIRPEIDANNPYAARGAHFDVPAKQVLVIYLPGAVSHVDTFDYKPALEKLHGKKPPGLPTVTFEGPSGNIAKPFWDFKPRGESGKMVSDLLPNLAEQVDDFCFFHALTTDTSAHPQGENFMNTGFTMEGFPSFGSWVTYALGTEAQELPAFVAINDPRRTGSQRQKQLRQRLSPRRFSGNGFQCEESSQQSAQTRQSDCSGR